MLTLVWSRCIYEIYMKLYSVRYTLYTILYTVYCILYTIQYAGHSLVPVHFQKKYNS